MKYFYLEELLGTSFFFSILDVMVGFAVSEATCKKHIKENPKEI
jgi:hypothetical protein